MTKTTPSHAPTVLRRLNTTSATTLVELTSIFEDLQSVLGWCERLMTELAVADGEPDDLVIEAMWTVAVLSYARCFSPGRRPAALTEDDVDARQLPGEALEWHRMMLRLREHYCDPGVNPRERFSVGVSQDSDGAASGVGVTSVRQPLVDVVTVRQTGAIAFALSGLVNDRIGVQQAEVFVEARSTGRAVLDKLARLDVATPGEVAADR